MCGKIGYVGEGEKEIQLNDVMINKLIWWNGEMVNKLNGEMVKCQTSSYGGMVEWWNGEMLNLP